MTEKTLQQKVVKFCTSNGILAYKFASPAHAGVPDLILIAHGKTIFLELKHPNGTGRLSALQTATIAKMRAHGAEVYCEYDFDTITALIRERLVP